MDNLESIPKIIYSCDEDFFIVELIFAYVDDDNQIIYIDKNNNEFLCGDIINDSQYEIYEGHYLTKQELIDDWRLENKKFIEYKKKELFEIENQIQHAETEIYIFNKRNNLNNE